MSSFDVVTLGELLIDFLPATDSHGLPSTDSFTRAAGGAPANVAVGLARLGLKTGFVGKVGADPFGKYLAAVLESEGVDVTELRFEPEAPTALAFVTHQANGEREFTFYRQHSADVLLQPDEVRAAYVEAATVFHFGSLSLTNEPARAATRKAISVAQEAGRLVSFDANLRLALWESAEQAKAQIMWAAGASQLVKLSEEELRFLTGKSEAESARSLLHNNMRAVLITLGEGGARYVTPMHEGHIPGYRVQAIDSTGAGDAFTAGFLSLVSRDSSILHAPEAMERAVRFANAVGALTTTKMGAIPSLPSRSEVDDLMTLMAVGRSA